MQAGDRFEAPKSVLHLEVHFKGGETSAPGAVGPVIARLLSRRSEAKRARRGEGEGEGEGEERQDEGEGEAARLRRRGARRERWETGFKPWEL